MPKKINKKIILLFGPTASGKSKIAEDIAKIYNAEIINADSMQIYKEVKILSARPEKKNIKHHLYGFVSIKKNFSTGFWYKLATKKIKQINKKGKIAIVVGGTGLYFKALTDGFSQIPTIPEKYKKYVTGKVTHDPVNFVRELDRYWKTDITQVIPQWKNVFDNLHWQNIDYLKKIDRETEQYVR